MTEKTDEYVRTDVRRWKIRESGVQDHVTAFLIFLSKYAREGIGSQGICNERLVSGSMGYI